MRDAVCVQAYLTKASARRHKGPHSDVRLDAKEPLDVIHMDTLHLVRDAETKVREVDDHGDKIGVVMADEVTDDIMFGSIPNKAWEHVRDHLVHFGGGRGCIKRCVCDRAPEFRRALAEMQIANFAATPGRSTSHAKAERANRTCLELARSSLLQSGLDISWAHHAISCGLWRLAKTEVEEKSIFETRHPESSVPER